MVEDASVTLLCRKVFSATLLTTWSSFALRVEQCLLCLPRRFSMKTPALAGAGGLGRCHTPNRLVLSWCQGSHTPNLSAQGLLAPAAPHCSPLHLSLPGDVPSLIKTTLKFSHGLSVSAACPAPLCRTVCGLMAVLPTQDRSLLGTAQNHPTPIMDPRQTHPSPRTHPS